jgi:hypothetical protein
LRLTRADLWLDVWTLEDGAERPGTALAMNAHNLDAMVVCFADDYVNEWPTHPPRGFRGSEEVRRNWTQIFAGLPNLRARLPRMTVGYRIVVTGAASSGRTHAGGSSR